MTTTRKYKFEHTISTPLDLDKLHELQKELTLRYGYKPTLKDCLEGILIKALRDKDFW